MNIRNNVKRLCALQGITQKELADKLGVTDVSLNTTLKDTKDPRISTLRRIADALGVHVTELLADEATAAQTLQEPQVMHVPYLRCPHCGEEIELYVKALGTDNA